MNILILWIAAMVTLAGTGWADLISLEKIQGDVRVLKRGTAAWVPAVEAMGVEPGDKIKTGDNGRVRVQLKEAVVDLEEKTEFAVKDHTVTADQMKTSLELTLGKLKAKVGKLKQGSHFEIRTPTSVAAVRGTIFLLWVYEYLGEFFSRLSVEEGNVNFGDLDSDENYDVGEGEYSTGGEDGITEPKKGEDDSGDEAPDSEDPNSDYFGDTGDYDSEKTYRQDTDGSQDNEQGSPVEQEEPSSDSDEPSSNDEIPDDNGDCRGQKC